MTILRRFTPALLAALLAAPAARAAEGTAALAVPFVQGKPLAELLKRAKAENRPLMVDVYATWCGPCKLMDRTTFSDPAVGAWAKAHVVPVKIDAEKGDGRWVAQRYMVSAFPTILFLDPSGNEIDRIVAVYPPGPFVTVATSVVDGKSPLVEAIASLKKKWSPREAAAVAQELARRNDVARMRPVVLRLVSEEDDLGNPEVNVQLLALLAGLEDWQGRLDPETGDLVATVLPRTGSDPSRGVLALALGRDQLRHGDVAAARETVSSTLRALGDRSAYAPDLYALLGAIERKAGRYDASLAALTTAAKLSDATGAPATTRGEREMDLAETLAAAGKKTEARTARDAALARWGNDPEAYVRASKISLTLKAYSEALAYAQKAVGLSKDQSASAQASLGAALDATGDKAGAAAAWKRAAELDPDNPEYRPGKGASGKKPGGGGAS